MKEISNKNSQYIVNLEAHLDATKDNLKYSLNRFDILIISISSGGLALSMGFVKDILLSKPNVNFLMLKISWILFTLSIVSNLLSQVTSYYANKFEVQLIKNIIKKEKGKELKEDQIEIECKKCIYNKLTHILNGLSLLLLIFAIIILVVFMIISL
ncbi:MAG: hypothetical protein NTZ33_06700 [Bacteroidetes bacterium]|nr:hypothetical protein [Bacteroidota bacterium]